MASYADVETDFRRLDQLVEIIESCEEDGFDDTMLHLNLGELAFWCKDLIRDIEGKLKKGDGIDS